VVQDGVHWRALVNTAVDFQVPLKRRICWPAERLSALLYEVVYCSLHWIVQYLWGCPCMPLVADCRTCSFAVYS
jgi:hypothetical protein